MQSPGRQGSGSPYETVATLTPWWTGAVTPQDDGYDVERRSIWRSLNFRIRAADLFGSLRFTVTLDTGHTGSVSVEARLVQTLRVRVFPVRYRGPETASPPAGTIAEKVDLPAPSLADVQTTAAQAFLAMPVQQTGSFAVASQVNWFDPLDDPRDGAGGCSVYWNSFIKLLKLLRENDGNRADVVYYGLLPANMPVNVRGCGDDGIGAGRAFDRGTFLHEIGHGYGFQHTPSGDVGEADPNYPVYEPYPSASTGEYGLDVDTGMVFAPATSTDYMSYGLNPWMSLYQHGRLVGHPRLAPHRIPAPNPFLDVPREFDRRHRWWPDPPWEADLSERYAVAQVISVHGTISEEGQVQVDSVARVQMNPVVQGPVTGWSVQLVGESGEVVSRSRVVRSDTHGHCRCGPARGCEDPDGLPLTFHAVLPDTEPGRALQLVRPEGGSVWERYAPDQSLRFAELGAQVEDEVIHLAWSFDGDGEALDVWAQWSSDEEGWHGLAVGLGDGRAEISVVGLPEGEVAVRLLAHDGFLTLVSEGVRIQVPDTGAQLAVLFPADGQRVPAGVEIEARGHAVDQAGAPLPDEQLEWLLDGESIGEGRTAALHVKPGKHRLSLRDRRTKSSATVELRAHG